MEQSLEDEDVRTRVRGLRVLGTQDVERKNAESATLGCQTKYAGEGEVN